MMLPPELIGRASRKAAALVPATWFLPQHLFRESGATVVKARPGGKTNAPR